MASVIAVIKKKGPIPRPSLANGVDVTYKPKGFRVNKKLSVYISHQQISELRVDAIARVDGPEWPFSQWKYARAAGQAPIDEYNSITNGGRPGTENVIVTSAGDLPCRFILHASVRPWSEEDADTAKTTRIEELRHAYIDIFQTADKKGCKSVACPLVGNIGTHAFPLDDAAKIIPDVILKLDAVAIDEVHVVCVDECELQRIYDGFLVAEKSRSNIVELGEERVMHGIKGRIIQRSSRSSQRSPVNNEKKESSTECTWSTDFQPVGYKCRNTCIYVHMCDITNLMVDAYVNSIHECDPGYHGLSATIAGEGGPKIVEACQRITSNHQNCGQVILTEGGLLSAKYVLHAMLPVSKVQPYDDLHPYLDILSEIFHSLIKEILRLKISSIAIPPIGSAGGTISQAVEIMCQVFVEAMKEGSSLQHVHFVDISDGMLELIGSLLGSLPLQPIALEEVKRRIASVDNERSNATNVFSHKTADDDMTATCTLNKQPFSVSVSSRPGASYMEDVSLRGNRTDRGRRHTAVRDEVTRIDSDLDRDVCVICLEEIIDSTTLECKHTFCKPCISHLFETYTPRCPSCGMLYGTAKGNQPEGEMEVTFSETELPGHEGHGSIWIDYIFESGVQGENHPNPGVQYAGSGRTAFLPDTVEGRLILELLRKAFEAKLLFTIGRSVTTGCDNVVTWNDVHHKTSIDGGPTEYGYPDPTYLGRVKEELAAKGIV